MTKTLTEQLKDGTIPDGFYYMIVDYDDEKIIVQQVVDGFGEVYSTLYIKEVLAPVPSYEEYKALVNSQKATKKLANPKRKNKVCKDVVREIITDDDYQEILERCHKLQEQLKEANKMLLGAKHLTVKDSNGAVMFELESPEIYDYLKKWGVK